MELCAFEGGSLYRGRQVGRLAAVAFSCLTWFASCQICVDAVFSGAVNEAVQQLAFADTVVVNKTDLVNEEELKGVTEKIKSVNAFARIVQSQKVVPRAVIDGLSWLGFSPLDDLSFKVKLSLLITVTVVITFTSWGTTSSRRHVKGNFLIMFQFVSPSNALFYLNFVSSFGQQRHLPTAACS